MDYSSRICFDRPTCSGFLKGNAAGGRLMSACAHSKIVRNIINQTDMIRGLAVCGGSKKQEDEQQ